MTMLCPPRQRHYHSGIPQSPPHAVYGFSGVDRTPTLRSKHIEIPPVSLYCCPIDSPAEQSRFVHDHSDTITPTNGSVDTDELLVFKAIVICVDLNNALIGYGHSEFVDGIFSLDENDYPFFKIGNLDRSRMDLVRRSRNDILGLVHGCHP